MTSSDLRIGMVSVDSPPHIGGIGRHVGSLLDGLRRAGTNVQLFDRTNRPIPYMLGRNVGFSIGLASALASWVQRESIDLLHIHAGPGGVFLPFPPIPMIVTANHTYAQQARLPWQGWKSLLKSAEWTTYLSALSIVCISTDTAYSIREDYRIAPNRICTIPCGFDLVPLIAVDTDVRDPKHCVFVGRRDTRKGFDLLCSAWTLVRRSHPDAVLSVIGVTEKDREGIRFLGRLPDEELRRCLGRSRMLIAPSRLEGFGLAAAEAIAAGTPVVATDVSGLRSVVENGVSGLLTTLQPARIAEAICSLLSDDQLWSTLHHGCQNVRARFSLESEVQSYRALYDEVYLRPHA